MLFISDDAIIDYIFSSCDKEKYGFVQANELVDFFLKISGSNEIWYICFRTKF